MMMPRAPGWMFLLVLPLLAANAVFGQKYPERTVRIVASEPGGGTDFVARIVAQGISGPLGQQVIIDNRPADILGELVSKAPPDGYTLLIMGSVIWIEPLLREHVAYDPVKDLAPITSVSSSVNILVVHPSVPAKSVQELIALARARPGALNYGSAGTGSSTQLAAELFNSMAGVKIVHVPYKGGGPAVTGLLSGEVQVSFGSAGSLLPHIKSGRVRVLATTGAKPSALFPDYPTIAASGLPGYESISLYGMFAPSRTPAAVISRLNQEAVRVLSSADTRDRFSKGGIEPLSSTPEQFGAVIKSEMAKWGKVIKDAGIRAG